MSTCMYNYVSCMYICPYFCAYVRVYACKCVYGGSRRDSLGGTHTGGGGGGGGGDSDFGSIC